MFSFKRLFCRKELQKIEALELKIEGLQLMLKEAGKDVYAFKEKPLIYAEPVKITHTEVHALMGGASRMFLSDLHYYGIDKEDVQAILERNKQISDAEYLSNDHDCEDFASATLGLFNQPTLSRFAFGYAVSKSHAYNFFIDRDKKLWVVEPQSGRVLGTQFNWGSAYETIKYFV